MTLPAGGAVRRPPCTAAWPIGAAQQPRRAPARGTPGRGRPRRRPRWRRPPRCAGSSATSTTARSSGWSGSRWTSAGPGKQLDEDPSRAGETIDAALLQARETVDELRSLSRGIAPPLLVDRGLAAALGELTVAQRGPGRGDASTCPATLPPHVETAVYFVVAEALTNVAKHSGATPRRRSASWMEHGDVEVRVEDDGVGGAHPAKGSGLAGLEQRVLAADGTLEVSSPPGGPTVVTAVAARRRPHEDRRRRRLRSCCGRVSSCCSPRPATRSWPRVGDGPSFVAAMLEHRPDVGVVDVRMPPSHTDEGLRAAVEVRRAWPEARIMVLSQYVEVSYADDLLASGDGGVGYLLKDRVSDLDDFLAALATVADGGTALDPQVVAQLMGRRPRPARARSPRASARCSALMAEGRSNAAIAEALVVTAGAVEKHTQRIFAKLGLLPDDAGAPPGAGRAGLPAGVLPDTPG